MKRILFTGAMLFFLFTASAQTKPVYLKLDSLMQLRKYYIQEISIIDLKIQDLVFDVTSANESENKSKPIEKTSPTTVQPASQSSLKSSSTTSASPTTYQSSATKPASATQRRYYTGSRGGCYYLSASGKKVYVDRSYCN